MILEALKSTFDNTPVLFRIIALNFGLMVPAMMVSWSSPCLPKLDGTKDAKGNPLPSTITTFEKSLLASAPMLSATLTCYLAPVLMRSLRRKFTYILLVLPNTVGLIIIGFSFNFWMLCAGRLICGISYTAVLQIVPRYSAELSLPQHRGAMCCFMAVFMTLGHLFSFAVGPFLNFEMYNRISLIPSTVLIFLLIFYVDESPYDLIQKNPAKARKILHKLRRKSTGEGLDEELEAIRLFVLGYHQLNIRDFCTDKALRKSLTICVVLVISTHLTGLVVVLSYMQEVFIDARVASPEMAAIYVGITQFISTFLPPFVMDRMGRKVILALSQVGILLCLCAFATYNTMLDIKYFDMDMFRSVPMVSLFFMTSFFYNGIGLVPFVLMGEIFPPRYKNISATVALLFQSLFILIMTWGYPLLVDYISLANTLWLYAGFTFLGLIYTIVFVPETKQKTFEEIQTMMER